MGKLNQYRTPIFNLVMALVAVIQVMGGFGSQPVPDANAVGAAIDTTTGAIGILWAVGNFVLQMVKKMEAKNAAKQGPQGPGGK